MSCVRKVGEVYRSSAVSYRSATVKTEVNNIGERRGLAESIGRSESHLQCGGGLTEMRVTMGSVIRHRARRITTLYTSTESEV